MMGNIYLTGMMGCGKTAIGRKTARKTGRKFLDIDACIEKETGSTITHIFETLGEAAFRKMETGMLRRIAVKEKDAIVSCGGGIILSDENIALMKQSGVIIYIERDIEEIAGSVSIKNRPVLRQDRDNIKRVFESRRRRYESSCDSSIRNNASIEEAADLLIAQLKL